MKLGNLEQLAAQVSPENALRYALAKSWQRVLDVAGGIALLQRADSDLAQLIIPVKSTGPDYARRIVDVVANLAEWEGRQPEEILSDLLLPESGRVSVAGEPFREAVNERRRAMSPNEVVIAGTLKPDGTLELDQKPNLPAGRVLVIVQVLPDLPAGDPFFAMLKDIWATRARAGLTLRSEAEVKAVRQQLNDEMEAEIAEAMRLQEECRATRKQIAAPEPEAE